MKTKINGIIVVEGKTDVAFLSEFIDAEFVITNGSEISEKTIEYLKNCRENRDIFVLTDPDSPGKRIRDVLDTEIPNLKHCFVSKEKSIKHNKVGVAESTKDEVLNALKNYIVSSKDPIGHIQMSDLVKIGLVGARDSDEKREKVCEKFHLGFCNAKTFLKRLNNCGITLEEIEKSLWTRTNTLKMWRAINFLPTSLLARTF